MSLFRVATQNFADDFEGLFIAQVTHDYCMFIGVELNVLALNSTQFLDADDEYVFHG